MSEEFWWILPTGLVWVPLMAWLLHGFGRLRPGATWLAGWVCLWLAGLLVTVGELPDAGFRVAAARVFALSFGALLLAGTYPFSQQPVPRWLAAVTAGVTLVLGAMAYAGMPEAKWLTSLAGAGFLGLGAYRLFSRYTFSPEHGPAERTLGPLFLALAVRELVDGDGANAVTMGAWLALAIVTAFTMIITVGERARRGARRGEAALDIERAVLAGMTEAVPVGILLSDPEGRIVRINEHLREQFRLEKPTEAWAGKIAWDLMEVAQQHLAPRDRSEVERYAGWIAKDRRRPLHAQELHFKDGRILVMSAHPVHGEDGEHLGRVWVSRDVTEESRVAERIQHAERMETLGTLTGGLAHDFNNQLTAILGNAALVREAPGLAVDDRRMLEDLEEAAQHCADLTRGLLTFARREPAEPGPVAVGAIVERVGSLLRPSIPAGVELRIQVEPDLPRIQADEVQFQRVLMNLLVNARDAVEGDGTVALTVQRAPDGVEVVVSDDGRGMEEATRRQMFDPFFTTKPVGEGTGLGLAIVYGIVEAHGGRIEIDTAPGDGTSFSVVWPLAAETQATPARQPVPMIAGRVLLAEDDPSVRRLVRRGLERSGLRVTAVEGGREAVETFEKRRDEFDIAVFDYKMPGATGLEALRRIRERAPGFPALVVSGHPESAGDEGWPTDVPLLLKPFDPRRLAERIAQVLADAAAG